MQKQFLQMPLYLTFVPAVLYSDTSNIDAFLKSTTSSLSRMVKLGAEHFLLVNVLKKMYGRYDVLHKLASCALISLIC